MVMVRVRVRVVGVRVRVTVRVMVRVRVRVRVERIREKVVCNFLKRVLEDNIYPQEGQLPSFSKMKKRDETRRDETRRDETMG